jgi:type VI secretion system protein ImpE
LPDANELLHQGDLAGARAALVEKVRAQPADEQARMFLFQLLALTGEWDKARIQVQALAQLSAEAQMLAAAYGQAIEAEAVRKAVFAGTAKIDIIADPNKWADGLADALQMLAQGKSGEGLAARDAAFDNAPDCPGTLGDTRFEWLTDADTRFGPSFEIIIAGRYGLVPFDAVARITSDGPVDLRDLIWYPVQIAFKSGQSVAAFLPARYPGTESTDDNQQRLARATGWSATAWGEAGSGQHLWTLSDGEDHGLLSLRTLVFD